MDIVFGLFVLRIFVDQVKHQIRIPPLRWQYKKFKAHNQTTCRAQLSRINAICNLYWYYYLEMMGYG